MFGQFGNFYTLSLSLSLSLSNGNVLYISKIRGNPRIVLIPALLLTATAVYLVQSLAAIKAWPEMYTEGRLNPLYASIINQEIDIVATMRQLDALGIDCRSIIKEVLAQLSTLGGEDIGNIELDATTLMAMMNQACGMMGVSLEELNEMLYDSGIDLNAFIAELIAYFNEEIENAEDNEAEATFNRAAARLLTPMQHPTTTPAEGYEQQLRRWLEQ